MSLQTMKTNRIAGWLVVVLCGLALVAGCKKSDGTTAAAKKDGKITGSPSDPPVAIELKWSPGQRYIMRMESAQSYQLPNMPGMGGRGRGAADANNQPLQNNFAQEYSLTITNAADNHRGMEMEILALELLATRGEQEFINYESRNTVAPRTNPMTDVFDQLIGGKIYFLVAPDNKVVKVEGVKELFDRIDPPADPNADAGAARGRRGLGGGGAMLRGAYNEDVFRQMIEMAGAPPGAVRVGEHWTTTQTANAPVIGKLTITTTNTLRGWQEHEGRKCARVEFTGSVAFSTNAGPMAAFLKLEDGSVTGRYWFAPDLGIPVETLLEQELVLTIPNFGAQGRRTNDAANAASTNAPRSFSTPMKQNISVKLVEVKPIGG